MATRARQHPEARHSAADSVAALGSKAAAVIAQREAACLLAVVAIWLLVRTWYAGLPLWFDELFTFYIARLPHLDQVFRALAADGNPPLYYLLARTSIRLLGESEFAVRLPAMFGFLAAALAVFVYIRRRRGAVFAFFGMLMLLSGSMVSYGSEARPYSLMLGFTGLALVSWQAAGDGRRSRLLPLLGVAAGIAGAAVAHHYGTVHIGTALLFGESVRIVKRRRLDIPLYCAAAAGLSVLAWTLPFASASQHLMFDYVRQSPVFWSKPSVWRLRSYGAMVPLFLPPAFLLLFWFTRGAAIRREDPGMAAGGRVPAHEIAAAGGLALMVPVMIGLTSLTTHYYMGRYAIGSAMGIAMLAGLLAPALSGARSRIMAVSALCVVLMVFVILIKPTITAVTGTAARYAASATPDSLLSRTPGGDPIVVASALEYMQDWWYAPPKLRPRLRYLADVPFAVREPDFLPEVSLVAGQPYIPCKLDPYRKFLSTHRQFFVYAVGMPRLEWVLRRLKSAGWSLKPVGRQGDFVLYIAKAPA